MNYLLAKLKGIRGQIGKVASSNKKIIESPKIDSNVKYSSTYKLEDEEWFELVRFSLTEFANETIGINFNSTYFNQIDKKDFANIKYFWIRQDGLFYYQKVFPSQVVTKKWFRISDEPVLEDASDIIILNPLADAVYDPENDSLFFKEISRIKPIFKNIGILYREATENEVQEFLESEFIIVANDYEAGKVNVPNRKRIAMAIDTLNSFEEGEKAHIFKYIRKYCVDLDFDKSSFKVCDNEDLKKVLWGIEQRYYTTELGHEKRLANSVVTIK